MHLLRDVREAAMTRRLTPFEKASNDEATTRSAHSP
jgi:hypothetical protein